MIVPSHLTIEEIQVPPGGEWMDASVVWRCIRMGQGAAYWLGAGQARQLNEGEILVAAPAVKGVIRASQLNPVVAHGFNFSHEILGAVLSLDERHFFETQASSLTELLLMPSTHPVSERFASIVGMLAHLGGMRMRVEALILISMLFHDQMQKHRRPVVRTSSAAHRFHQLVSRISDQELTQWSSDDMARLCSCSVRHFNRLFRRRFGQSITARQTELRLLKSSRLLMESDAKVVCIALDSGYNNLSLFNSMFKKRFKMTPSQWRRKHASRILRSARKAMVACLIATGLICSTRAQSPVSNPASGTNQVQTLDVRGYELVGNTLLPDSITAPILQKHTNSAATFDSIRKAMADLLMAYRERGFVTVGVAVPRQSMTNGILKLQITEGRLAEISVVGNRYYSSNSIVRALPCVRTNVLLNGLVLQQQIDRANANPDRQIYPVLDKGFEPGTSSLVLKVKDRLPLHARLEVNNNSTPNTPDLRVNFSAQYNNLWQRDHQVGVQYTFTPADYKQGSYPLYDLPLVVSYSAFYRMPLGNINGSPLGRDYAVGDFGYDEATRRFRPPMSVDSGDLIVYASRSFSDSGIGVQSEKRTPDINFMDQPASSSSGGLQIHDVTVAETLTINEGIGARISRPLPAFLGLRTSLSLGMDFKKYQGSVEQTRTFQAQLFVPKYGTKGPPFEVFNSPPVTSSQNTEQVLQYCPFSIGWDGLQVDRLGSTMFNINQSFNFDGMLGSRNAFESIAGDKASGNYYIIAAGLTRELRTRTDWGVRIHADGQWGSQPLVSNEQYGLGGSAGVRGYQDGQEYGDAGWRVQLEPHTPWTEIGMVDGTIPMMMRFYVFADYGQRFLYVPATRQEMVEELGAGGGFSGSIGQHMDFRFCLGMPVLSTPGRKAGEVLATFGVGVQF
jgi:hemolysin activation/secretion protein/AraC-like DNA-binding protein